MKSWTTTSFQQHDQFKSDRKVTFPFPLSGIPNIFIPSPPLLPSPPPVSVPIADGRRGARSDNYRNGDDCDVPTPPSPPLPRPPPLRAITTTCSPDCYANGRIKGERTQSVLVTTKTGLRRTHHCVRRRRRRRRRRRSEEGRGEETTER